MSIAYNSSIVRDGLVLNLDAGNVKSYSVNVHPYPTDIGRWTTSGSNATLTRDTSVTDSPVRGIPLKMAITGTDPYTSTYNNSIWNLAPAVSGQTWTASVYVKASAVTEGTIFLFEANSSGSYTALSTNVVPITTSWTRISVTRTFNNGTTAYVQVRLDGPDSSGSGIDIWWDGLQVEQSASPTTFNPKTNLNGTSWYDLSGIGNNAVFRGWNSISTSTISNVKCFYLNGSTASNGDIEIPSFYGNHVSGDNTHTMEWWGYANSLSIDVWNSGVCDSVCIAYGESGNYYDATGTLGISAGIVLSEWHQYVLVQSGSTATSYRDGVQIATRNDWGLPGTASRSGVIGSRSWANRINNWYLSNMKWYNRALSVQEISQNFEASRGRFGV